MCCTVRSVGQWVFRSLKEPVLRSVRIMKAISWIALSGSQMTLLPLLPTDANHRAFTDHSDVGCSEVPYCMQYSAGTGMYVSIRQRSLPSQDSIPAAPLPGRYWK